MYVLLFIFMFIIYDVVILVNFKINSFFYTPGYSLLPLRGRGRGRGKERKREREREREREKDDTICNKRVVGKSGNRKRRKENSS